ncbi:MAG TPA: chemotaxis protein CheA [Thermoanaerobaculia bacterium]|nr:chemotaxis protein CheA [Thermoanaerobaculia bacterium]HUM31148.1 chemotaxis protein CheA [Thermoanaerobaculia bacterium]HXK69504.1 chemotaxis protein CheA [Thermoanaerobaculia bacterium]
MTRTDERSIREFLSEAEELVEQLTLDLKAFEESGDRPHPQLVNKIFRSMHSLKGLSGMMGFTQMSEVAHALEDLLDRLRMGKVKGGKSLVDILYDGLTVLNQMSVQIAEKGDEKVNTQELLRHISAYVSQKPEESSLDILSSLDLDEQTRKSLTEYEEHRLKENLVHNRVIHSIEVHFSFEIFDVELKQLSEKLNAAGEVISTLPSISDKPDEIRFRLIFASEHNLQEVQELVGERFKVSNLVKSEEQTPTKASETPAEESIRSVSRTVRVNIDRLDTVMNIVGELILERNNLDTFAKVLSDHHIPTSTYQELEKIQRSLSRKLSDLQKSVIDIRMVPISQILTKLNRVIRQLALDFGKEIELHVKGEETELDKVVIEEITDPLLHIIRNCLDHGIEPPSERQKKGKPTKGTINFEATQKGNSVLIRISDDGKGIDLEKISRIAKRKNLLTEEEITEERLLNLIFSAGFSSAEKVSQVSGRGVGLDVVKQNISQLKGNIRVLTEKDKGTTFEIVLPITLAIIQALIVVAGDQTFAIPLTVVTEALRINESDIESIEQREVYYLRDFTLPLLRLSQIFDIDQASTRTQSHNHLFVVVAQVGEQRVGIVVDRLVRQQEIVIKNIGSRLKGIPGIAGAAELGTGNLVLVIDVSSIMEKALEFHGKLTGA